MPRGRFACFVAEVVHLQQNESAHGSALISVTLLMFLFSAIAVAAAVVVRVEVIVAERFRQSAESFHGAHAALEVAVSELRAMTSWSMVVNGGQTSQFVQGTFVGVKTVPGGGSVNVCCTADSIFEQLMATSRASPVPVRRALVWRPFLWTTFNALAPRDPPSRLFLMVFVADDEEDVQSGANGDTNGLLLLRAEAVDPAGLHRAIEALVARPAFVPSENTAGIEGSTQPPSAVSMEVGIVTWREVRP